MQGYSLVVRVPRFPCLPPDHDGIRTELTALEQAQRFDRRKWVATLETAMSTDSDLGIVIVCCFCAMSISEGSSLIESAPAFLCE